MAFKDGSGRAKFQVLCLHGIGSNSEIFEAQTAALRYQLGSDYQYDFLDGEYPWPAARGISQVFGDQQTYSYFDGSAESVFKALDDLSAYVVEHGPFDAVMGFSLGAALAATLLLRNEDRQAPIPIKCAIFLCGTLPCDWNELELRRLRLLEAKDVQHTIQIPTVHVWSADDVEHPGHSAQLVQMCETTKRVEVIHSGGHTVPSQGNDSAAFAHAVHQTFSSLV